MSNTALFPAPEAVSRSSPQIAQPKVVRWSCPSPGRSLGASVTRVERPIREAIKLLNRAVAVDEDVADLVFDCTVYGPGFFREPNDLRLSWFVVCAAIAHSFVTRRTHVGPVSSALEWFFGEESTAQRLLACFSQQQVKDADEELKALVASEELLDLLPYVLEPHGHITRKGLESCEVAKRTRAAKKDTGVYYTPSDVAAFMVGALVDTSKTQGSWLDPACGTGVFLRAILENQWRSHIPGAAPNLRDFAVSRVFGIDKSALTTDLAAFVVLLECSRASQVEHTQFELWRRIKANIVCMDALRLSPPNSFNHLQPEPSQVATIRDIFPSASEVGFDHVVMNPPYAAVRIDKTLQMLWHSYSGIADGQSGDTHLAFTEMLWRLTSADASSAAVLPLAVGSNTTRSYLRLRGELLASPGTKEFLFFDREPQALFGEDIKTRNLILFRHSASNAHRVTSSRLLKWTADQRPTIFRRDRVVDIDRSHCRAFVPKLGSSDEAAVYSHLRSPQISRQAALHAPRISRLTLDDVLIAGDEIRRYSVLTSSTAYNFINCFFSDALPANPPKPYSSSPINALCFNKTEDAYAAFSIASSRLCFWLWHVEGDGFHLTSDFLRRLPLWGLLASPEARHLLSQHGRSLWLSAANVMVGAVNGGKQTYSFHCGYDHPSAVTVERALLCELGIGEDFSRSLDAFIHATVSIDGSQRMRRTEPKLRRVV